MDPRDSAAALHSGQGQTCSPPKAIGGSGKVPPRGGGNNKLNPALVPASSFECGRPALDLLPGVIAVAVVRGPGGVTPELLLGAGLAKQCQRRPMLVVGSGSVPP